MDAAKRYRVDAEKIGKAVAETFAAKQKERKAGLRKRQSRSQPSIPRQQALNPASSDLAESLSGLRFFHSSPLSI